MITKWKGKKEYGTAIRPSKIQRQCKKATSEGVHIEAWGAAEGATVKDQRHCAYNNGASPVAEKATVVNNSRLPLKGLWDIRK